ncbi:hypothetical protein GCM10027347_40170 [Larkinella harenae]
MGRFTLLFILLLVGKAFGQEAPTRYSITGHLSNLKGRTIYLATREQAKAALYDAKAATLDSCRSADGHFSFQGIIGEAGYYAVFVRWGNGFNPFLLDNAPVSILGDANSPQHVSIVGSTALRQQLLLDKMLEPFVKRRDQLEQLRVKAIQKGEKQKAVVYAQQHESVTLDMVDVRATFIESYASSPVSLFELNALLPNLPKEKAKDLWNKLDYTLQQHSVGRQIREHVFDRAPEPRQHMPNLILADQLTKPVSLLSYKGNVVLLDFWASWCEYCQQEHNRLKSLYQQYKDKGLQIISISVDEDPSAWQEALQKASLPWPQLSDRVGSRNVVGTQYGNGSVPINWLIDKEGYVIRKGLHGAELEKELAIVFNKP